MGTGWMGAMRGEKRDIGNILNSKDFKKERKTIDFINLQQE